MTMTDRPLILAIDQGTTSSRALVLDAAGASYASAQREFTQHYPRAGLVEHDAEEIWAVTCDVAQQAFLAADGVHGRVIGLAITNQRETTVVWDRRSGRPIHRAIVWQDRRTAPRCAALTQQGTAPMVAARTGLRLDPYFSATKIAEILDTVDDARADAAAGHLAFGTIDSFLISRLTGGTAHVTDATNASRTLLCDIHTGQWDPELCTLFDVPPNILPRILDSAGHFGDTLPALFGRALPILAVAGDQQAAAVGQAGFAEGAIKSTYGTGCFMLAHTGATPLRSSSNLLTTIALQLAGKRTYALEGSIFIAGAAVQWLRDGLGLVASATETETLARSVENTGGVYLVPAFAGLGAPHWAPDARGLLTGITRGTGRAEIVRAALECVAYQTLDLVDAMAADGVRPSIIRVDGGMTANDWLMQFLADILGVTVERPRILETTALGVAWLGFLAAGIHPDTDSIAREWRADRCFVPDMPAVMRDGLLAGWRAAVHQTIGR